MRRLLGRLRQRLEDVAFAVQGWWQEHVMDRHERDPREKGSP